MQSSRAAFVMATLTMPSLALAHGGEAIVALLIPVGQFVELTVSVVISLLLLKNKRQTAVVTLVCLAAVFSAWFLTVNVPFVPNVRFVFLVNLGLPLIMAAAAVLICYMFWQRRAPNSTVERDARKSGARPSP